MSTLPHPHLALLAALLVAVLLTACGADGAQQAEPGDVLPTIAFDEEPGLAHVHGLGWNPADEQLYVATHFGLWRVDPDSGEAQRVGEHFLDFMGFTVVGDDHFLASGHPPVSEELPPHLGLIETTDGGETWTSVSLLGSADFHALRYEDGTVYGWNTGDSALLVSENGGESWEERGEERILDFAVDPDDAEHILATSPVSPGELSVIRSHDGGRSWEDASGAPSLARVAWDADGALLAVGPEGGVWTSEDGRSWRERSAVPGFPEALLVSEDGIYLAAGGALLASADGGDSWELILRYQ